MTNEAVFSARNKRKFILFLLRAENLIRLDSAVICFDAQRN